MSGLRFTSPPPGLAPLVDFSLRAIDGAEGLYSLESTEQAGVRLFVLDASRYFTGYEPAVPLADRAGLGLEEADEPTVFVVANPGGDGTTVNLMAPILVNPATGAATQVILDGGQWPMRAPLAA
ncbi:flagellar assembly factor FliW [Arthrobacter pigmenti]|uniref:Flagellar assembly factor FliW n=1 Tax=Arthrobacter pigmenti TaxID=271432 RepID=A0A846RDW2_9MICC|nr:flagellar assembly protein FliW [Arthrobacter pigmenti]NJC21203.1 flagellar assembly factor FliW [Arthrobacter pigmenti]